MPYITREDGERFVIPSYRDVITAKNNGLLKKDIIALSQSYGEYITLQRRSPTQYDVAFSPDMGYLLGESIWHFFKRPLDMIYCEAVPNTTEAILVIVKEGGVYLDGRFPMDAIPEELIIFLTQKNSFEIYVHGDVPISQDPVEGKFSFDANSVKSFSVLEQPAFPTLPLLKSYQFQLVEPTLKRYGIGGLPLRQLLVVGVLGVALWMGWSTISSLFKSEAPEETVVQVNPYQGFYDAFQSPAPDKEISAVVDQLSTLMTIPGWTVTKITYASGSLVADMQSAGSSVENLMRFAKQNGMTFNVVTSGVKLTMTVPTVKRPMPQKIYPTKESIAVILDRLAEVYPGNHFNMAEIANTGVYTSINTTINFTGISPAVLDVIGQQLKDLPFVMTGLSFDITDNNVLGGTINLQLLGS